MSVRRLLHGAEYVVRDSCGPGRGSVGRTWGSLRVVRRDGERIYEGRLRRVWCEVGEYGELD
jgi:hypothetical protein